jgi:hypothetical protein
MSRTKLNFALAAIALLLISTLLCAWILWNYAAAWINPGLPSIASEESATPTTLPDATLDQTSISLPAPGEKFLGLWTGHWDNTLIARFTITRVNRKQLKAVYESEEAPGQPMTTKILHPWAADHVLHMPRAGVVFTLSDTLPNTAQAVVDFTATNQHSHHTATFVRNQSSTTNWLAASNSAPTAPILLDIKATIDGSDTLTLSQNGALWTHNTYQWPTDISINRIPWDAHTQPTLTATGLATADLSTATVISHTGRDLVEMNKIPDGITINFNDSPPGAAPYEIQIRFDPRKITPR